MRLHNGSVVLVQMAKTQKNKATMGHLGMLKVTQTVLPKQQTQRVHGRSALVCGLITLVAPLS